MIAASVWFPQARAVELRNETVGAPGAGEIRVRALASGLSHGTEMLVFRGEVPPHLALDLPTLAGSYGFPIKFGYASVGQVVAVGAGVKALAPGDRVFVHHPHQDEYVVNAASAVPLPERMPAEIGVFLANCETALNVVLDAHPRLGEEVAVFGQGVVGLLVTQLLQQAGASVTAVEPIALRRELALRCGADQAVAPEDALARIAERTGGRGADVVIEASGNAGALQLAIDAAASGSSVIVCSWYGTRPVSLDLGTRFHRERLRLVSSQVSQVDPALAPRWDRARRLATATTLLGELLLGPLITHRIPFAHAADAYELVDRRPEETVQVILTYD
ncbi:MAG TPA: zinc-binding dehydrogenase [Candidatus Limnocylindria bacterium]|nr:zinc-binding dehydrogenase [Candidatus Limnocylindria bacterium]